MSRYSSRTAEKTHVKLTIFFSFFCLSNYVLSDTQDCDQLIFFLDFQAPHSMVRPIAPAEIIRAAR